MCETPTYVSTDLWDNKEKDLHMIHSTQPNWQGASADLFSLPG